MSRTATKSNIQRIVERATKKTVLQGKHKKADRRAVHVNLKKGNFDALDY